MKKKAWPKGPWTREKAAYSFVFKGHACTIKRMENFGHLCGYAQLPPGHAWLDCQHDWQMPADIHGGVTFRGDFGWIGFDCAHGGDSSPTRAPEHVQHYKTVAFVTNEIRRLVNQSMRNTGGER